MKVGFVNIFGKPNAGKSTLLNALVEEKLAIVSNKVQTTRHRIKAFLTKTNEYQIIFSDTPGIIEPKYKLHEKMMQRVKNALEDADIALLLLDINDDWLQNNSLFQSLQLKVPAVVVINKTDTASKEKQQAAKSFFTQQSYASKVIEVSALQQLHITELLQAIIELLPEGFAFYPEDELTDLPEKFFAGEIIREKIYELFADEIPYHVAIIVNEFKEKDTLTKIQADIIVQRESQKAIVIGQNGKMIKKLGTLAREEIEKFFTKKIFHAIIRKK